MKRSFKSAILLAGRYSLLEQIGKGGFGTVYKARDHHRHNKLVAIKVIDMAALTVQEKIEVTDSFNREITLLTSLKHKNLPCIHEHFTDPEHWYIVMDYIEGQTLEDLLAHTPQGRLSVRQVGEIGSALCDVLSYLHSQNPPIIYRDVKPGNIMITPWGRLYLIDFGIARRYRAGQKRDTGSLGSPGYAAPEQYGRMQSTAQTDIYGLGATLQTLFTGKEPLEIRVQGIPSNIYIPTKLRQLIDRMMDPDPEKRPRNMDQVERFLPTNNTGQVVGFFGWFSGMSLNQSRLIGGSLFAPYLYLSLAVFLCCHIFTSYRCWSIFRGRLSAKATILFLGRQIYLAMLPTLILVACASLLNVFLMHPVMSEIVLLWFWFECLVLGTVALVYLVDILKGLFERYKWHQSQRSRSAPLRQQQMQKRP